MRTNLYPPAFKKIQILLFLIFLSSFVFAQTIYYVSTTGSDANNGTSWATSYRTLQKALAKATVTGGEIWVAAGTYYPDEGPGLSNNDSTLSFDLPRYVSIYGGFAGTETSLAQRNWQINITTLSGDIDNDGTLHGNSFHIIRFEGPEDGSEYESLVFDPTGSIIPNSIPRKLDGFFIKGGNSKNEDGGGGGIFAHSYAVAKISNCMFSENFAAKGGAVLLDDYPVILFYDCTFKQNNADSGGGVYAINYGYAKFNNCDFIENTGGGLYAEFGAEILNSRFKKNIGGGAEIIGDVNIVNCDFFENSFGLMLTGNGQVSHCNFSNNFGIGMQATYGSHNITNCLFTGNKPGGLGLVSSSANITNCLFAKNISLGSDFLEIGINVGSSVKVSNCTVYGPGLSSPKDVIRIDASSTVIKKNCIISNIGNVREWGSTTYSICENDLLSGEGNIKGKPLFVDPDNGDFRLQACSRAIDAGNNIGVITTADLDGNTRIVNASSKSMATVDMGAYEYQAVFLLYFQDNDKDGYGNAAISIRSCNAPEGYALLSGDCNDTDPTINPGAVEVCGNGKDDNCNGVVDENVCVQCLNAIGLTTTNITNTSAKLNWTATAHPLQWNIRYKSTNQGSQWIDSFATGNKRSIVINGLSPNQSCQWQIRAKCGKNWTTYSVAIQFVTSSGALTRSNTTANNASMEMVPKSELDVNASPNPSNSNFRIAINSSNVKDVVQLQVMDALGRVIETINTRAGQVITIGNTYRTGIYFVRIIQRKEMRQLKLIKISE